MFTAACLVGWAFGAHMTADLVIAALNMALLTRKPESVIHHSDQGSQYTSVALGKRCKEMGVRPSMGTVGDAYDNAMAESFFATLECELIDRRTWKTHTEAKLAVFTWIEAWYNPHRRHSSLGQVSPINFERLNVQKKEQTEKDAATQNSTSASDDLAPTQTALPVNCDRQVDLNKIPKKSRTFKPSGETGQVQL